MSNELLLIVEDELAIAELLEMVLTDGGYRVVTAANGRQGLERLTDGPVPDLAGRLTEPCAGTVPQHEQTAVVLNEPPKSGSSWSPKLASGPQASGSFLARRRSRSTRYNAARAAAGGGALRGHY